MQNLKENYELYKSGYAAQANRIKELEHKVMELEVKLAEREAQNIR